MKAERRHELQQNSLVRGIENLPSFWREQGSKIALAVIAAALVFVLVRWYTTSRTEKADRVAQQLAAAELMLSNFRETGQEPRMVRMAGQVRTSINDAVNDVLSSTDDPARLAEARLIRADLNWQLAALGDPSEAATRPDAGLKEKPAELLDAAAKEYQAVIDQPGLPPRLVARAHFGLAAVNEERRQWLQARSNYEAITKNPGIPKAFQDLATARIELLSKLEAPLLLGRPRRPEPAKPPPTPAFGPMGPTVAPPTGGIGLSGATPPATTQPDVGPPPATQPAATAPPVVPPRETEPAATQPAGPRSLWTQPAAPVGP